MDYLGQHVLEGRSICMKNRVYMYIYIYIYMYIYVYVYIYIYNALEPSSLFGRMFEEALSRAFWGALKSLLRGLWRSFEEPFKNLWAFEEPFKGPLKILRRAFYELEEPFQGPLKILRTARLHAYIHAYVHMYTQTSSLHLAFPHSNQIPLPATTQHTHIHTYIHTYIHTGVESTSCLPSF